MTVQILQGDCLEVLRTLPAESVNCCVTSPPYYGLRDYNCAAQIGLESSPSEFVAKLVAVFAEVWRVLTADGTLWLNLGDSYAREPAKGGSGPGGKNGYGEGYSEARSKLLDSVRSDDARVRPLETEAAGRAVPATGALPTVLKPKDLVGIPWRVAFALQAAGWYLRQDLIWHKPNVMPEPVTDRCTKSHEYIFLLSKSERYYFNQEAIQEPMVEYEIERRQREYKKGNATEHSVKDSGNGFTSSFNDPLRRAESALDGTRNKRSVWTVNTKPYKAAHFATFPTALILPCILAGCPEGGTVLDPFLGSGTTALVAQNNGCSCIGIELNPEYVKLARRRIQQRSLLV